MMVRLKLLVHAIRPAFGFTATVAETSGFCYACGHRGEWLPARIINDSLAQTWAISGALREGFDARESMFCPACGCSSRLRQLAECLTSTYGKSTLRELVKDNEFSRMQVAEINSCGKLHEILKDHPSLHYSEYKSDDVTIRSESLDKLTYNDETFDLVLTSDTLEHVPDIRKALKETRRVLRAGGKHIFTVPIIWNRTTNNREKLDPSYHGVGEPDYLVFNEFGHDMIEIIEKCGYSVKIYKVNLVNLNDVSGVIIATRIEGKEFDV